MEELLAFIVECIGEHDLSMWWVLVRMRGTRQQLGSSVRVVTTTVVWPLPATSHMDHPASWSSAEASQPQSGPEQRAADTVAGADTVASSRAGLGVCSVQCNYINQMLSPAAPAHCQPGCLAVYQQLQSTFLSCYCHEGGH